jgi:hypothetical protein
MKKKKIEKLLSFKLTFCVVLGEADDLVDDVL